MVDFLYKYGYVPLELDFRATENNKELLIEF